MIPKSLWRSAMLLLVLGILNNSPSKAQPPSRAAAAREAQRRVVKVYGAGGLQGLEAYQSGCVVSPEGHIATAWSYVLDVDDPLVVLDDGRRFDATIVGFEPQMEFAVLKIEATDLPYFSMGKDIPVEPLILAIGSTDGPSAVPILSPARCSPVGPRRSLACPDGTSP